jgi:uncharacterized protein YlxW (UPF0749 family)
MKYGISLLIVILFISAQSTRMFAQDSPSAAQAAQELRNQLSQLNDREAEIKIRLQELDYELKPENIEHYFAGVGSVHPEELREARRKKLQIEKDRLQAQLTEIGQGRQQLEAAIIAADTKAYQASALGAVSLKAGGLAQFFTATTLQLAAVIFALLVIGILLVARRKRHPKSL